jgi:NAD(P)-dependent dehydrogenase (short-subunit alcohol dehydrogenase family)
MEQTTKSNYFGALQHPIGSGFTAASTADDVLKGIDLTGKVAIVTGGYAGLGLETVRALSAAGATVVAPVRDRKKAEANLKGIKNVTIETMDLMDPATVDAFSTKFLATHKTLHILVNNAGIMWVPLRRDAAGNESQLSTNHFGHFRLTARLWPALKNAKAARVVNVSSWGHHRSDFNFEDPNFENRAYDSFEGYGQSKTANILFTVELDERGKQYGVRSYTLHPGAIVDTDLKRETTPELLIQLGVHDQDGNAILDPARGLKTIAQGASTQVWCATSPALQDLGGVYCEDNEVAVIDTTYQGWRPENGSLRGVMAYSLDQEHAQQLWTLTERMTGVTFDVTK